MLDTGQHSCLINFDSYGTPPPFKHWKQYLYNNSRGNVLVVQRYDMNISGYLCMDYITQRLSKPMLSNQSIGRHLDEYQSYYKFVNT